MSDIVLVALISVGGTLAATIIAHLYAAKQTTKSQEFAKQQKEVEWSREIASERSKSKADQLQKILALALMVQVRVIEWHEAVFRQMTAGNSSPLPPGNYVDSPTAIASEAYAVALLALPELRALAKDFYKATSKMQLAIELPDAERAEVLRRSWKAAFESLEKAIEEQAGP